MLSMNSEIAMPRQETRHDLLNRKDRQFAAELEPGHRYVHVRVRRTRTHTISRSIKSLAQQSLQSQVDDIPNRIFKVEPVEKVNFFG